jgi:hypothetical protein
MATVIDGSASVTINNGAVLGITSGTAVASTSGTSIDFTGLPSWVKRVTLMAAGLSTTSTVPITIVLGTSGGLQASGYVGSQGYVGGGPASTNMSTSFQIYNDTAAETYSGSVTFSLLNSSTNVWVASGVIGTTALAYMRYIGGYVTLSSALTQIRISTTTGTPTFDAGSINILYEG